MQLDVRYYQQQKSLSCGLAVLRMVFEYLGDKLTEKDLAESLKMHSFGTFLTDVGVLALDRGYKATTYTFHLPLLAPLKLGFGTRIEKELIQKVKPRPSDKMIFESWKKYLAQGGVLIWESPKIALIKSLIDSKSPCVINVNTAALNRYWRNWDNGHFLIVNGVDEKETNVLDPDPLEGRSEYKIENDLLLPAWAINAKRSSGYLMVVQKKN